MKKLVVLLVGVIIALLIIFGLLPNSDRDSVDIIEDGNSELNMAQELIENNCNRIKEDYDNYIDLHKEKECSGNEECTTYYPGIYPNIFGCYSCISNKYDENIIKNLEEEFEHKDCSQFYESGGCGGGYAACKCVNNICTAN